MASSRIGVALLTVALAVGGCSTMSKLNPFSSSSKVKATPLTPIQASVDMRMKWQASVGDAGDYVFKPAVVGDSVYAAGHDGTLARFDNGHVV
jgi:outer membrane protein assembly factor BamB